MHGDFYPGAGLPPPPEDLGTGYSEIARYPDGPRVLRVVARPAPAHALYTDGFGPSEIAGPQTTARWLVAERGRSNSSPGGPASTEHASGCRRTNAPAAPPRGLQRPAYGDGPALGRTAEVTMDLPRGRSWLEVSASPGLRPIPDGRSVSVYIGNWRFSSAPPVGAAVRPFRG